MVQAVGAVVRHVVRKHVVLPAHSTVHTYSTRIRLPLPVIACGLLPIDSLCSCQPKREGGFRPARIRAGVRRDRVSPAGRYLKPKDQCGGDGKRGSATARDAAHRMHTHFRTIRYSEY